MRSVSRRELPVSRPADPVKPKTKASNVNWESISTRLSIPPGQLKGVFLPGPDPWSVTLDGAHLLEPLHPGLALRSPLLTPGPLLHQPGRDQQQSQEESSFYSETGAGQPSVEPQPQQRRTINEFQLKFGLGWRRIQAALFHCAACCVRCLGPV